MAERTETTDRDACWRALMEIAFAELRDGPTPQYVREHAKRALKGGVSDD